MTPGACDGWVICWVDLIPGEFLDVQILSFRKIQCSLQAMLVGHTSTRVAYFPSYTTTYSLSCPFLNQASLSRLTWKLLSCLLLSSILSKYPDSFSFAFSIIHHHSSSSFAADLVKSL